MQIDFFYIPVVDNSQEVAELNKLLGSKKIIDVEKQFIADGKASFYSVAVRYIENSKPDEPKRSKVDYKEVLSPEVFQVYALLRDARSEIATTDGVPPYAVFNNAELAEIAELPELTLAAISKVKGVGKNKLEKYAKKMLEIYQQK